MIVLEGARVYARTGRNKTKSSPAEPDVPEGAHGALQLPNHWMAARQESLEGAHGVRQLPDELFAAFEPLHLMVQKLD